MVVLAVGWFIILILIIRNRSFITVLGLFILDEQRISL